MRDYPSYGSLTKVEIFFKIPSTTVYQIFNDLNGLFHCYYFQIRHRSYTIPIQKQYFENNFNECSLRFKTPFKNVLKILLTFTIMSLVVKSYVYYRVRWINYGDL